ncbi:MAG: undecaprenyl-diphosphatase [Nitrososphaerota archaeon]|nr:undecaprenyl-diphosphatase [Nitrososphaerota archaeon]MDG6979288.1 undecaprenyl-diphosphatase [Nitrososphaerota archaeon]MDG7005306.1 undecaprenyl-diphosphatase [Nitrososphaerota archaeon]
MADLLQLFHAMLLGIVQGIAEWLPVSSKTQVLLASSYLLNLDYQQAYTFGLFMEIGTVLAAVIYFRGYILDLLRVLAGSKDPMKRKLFVYVLVVTLVTGVIGAPLYLIADSVKGVSIGVPMLVIGAVLIGDALFIRYSRRRAGAVRRTFKDMKTRDYIIIGAMQGIAALPGVSRSGITVSSMLLLDFEADEAFKLSFVVGIFASLAAFFLTTIVSGANVGDAVAGIGLAGLGLAILTATLVSLVLIDALIKVASRSGIVYLTAGLGAIAVVGGILYTALGL